MKYSKEIIEKYYNYSAKDLNDNGICPTCFNRATNGHVFGDESKLRIYSDNDIDCLLTSNPRAPGHMMISSINHYHDLSEAPDYINEKIIRFTKQFMIFIKEIYGCERVYLCSMCDGPMNHYHVQLIPRYNFEERGSKNFVKPRQKFVYDEEKINQLKQKIEKYVKNNS